VSEVYRDRPKTGEPLLGFLKVFTYLYTHTHTHTHTLVTCNEFPCHKKNLVNSDACDPLRLRAVATQTTTSLRVARKTEIGSAAGTGSRCSCGVREALARKTVSISVFIRIYISTIISIYSLVHMYTALFIHKFISTFILSSALGANSPRQPPFIFEKAWFWTKVCFFINVYNDC